ncbi:TIGR04255 family protein [Paraburkholderia nemoris]|uniref:TIGR04255 family protein n=1 Tax=Paraburkholderia nemoris TaxID=2793076 RepID=UPI001B8CE307|nr:TIGR04255 family protein [Paraburkholderia nemoris]
MILKKAAIVTKTRIQPVSGAHAIEIMAIGIEWAVPLNETQLADLQTVYDGTPEIKEFVPQHSPVQGFSIQHVAQVGIGAPQPLPQVVQLPRFVTQAGGFDLRRLEPGGKISWVTSIRPQILSCNCSDYDRWKNVKPKALSILRPFVDAALSAGAQISAIGLQYQDAFRLVDGISQEATKELFRQDCRWLPAHVFDEPSFWHCHQGWFSKGPDERRVLNNVTTDVSDVNGVCFARIGGQHRVFSTSFDATTAINIGASEIDRILECLHDENKKVINGMLSDDALEAIGCSVGGA